MTPTLPVQIRTRRAALGMTQQQVSASSGVMRYAISRFETAQADLSMANLAKVVQALGGRLTAEWTAEFGEPVVE